jgi:hypothetical protein
LRCFLMGETTSPAKGITSVLALAFFLDGGFFSFDFRVSFSLSAWSCSVEYSVDNFRNPVAAPSGISAALDPVRSPEILVYCSSWLQEGRLSEDGSLIGGVSLGGVILVGRVREDVLRVDRDMLIRKHRGILRIDYG